MKVCGLILVWFQDVNDDKSGFFGAAVYHRKSTLREALNISVHSAKILLHSSCIQHGPKLRVSAKHSLLIFTGSVSFFVSLQLVRAIPFKAWWTRKWLIKWLITWLIYKSAPGRLRLCATASSRHLILVWQMSYFLTYPWWPFPFSTSWPFLTL